MILQEYGIPENLINAIKSLYDHTIMELNKNSFQVNQGLKQGCGLSPILFDLYMNKIMQDWRKTNPKNMDIGNDTVINSILFADDQVLLATTEDYLQENITKLNRILLEYNMKISIDKTKVMAMKGKEIQRAKIVINNQIIEQTSTFKYLGSDISIYKLNSDLDNNIQNYNKINGCIKRNLGQSMSKEIKLKLHNVISKPTLLYGSETWVLRAADKRRIETAEMRFLRPLLGLSLRDQIKSEEIRKQLKIKRTMVEEVIEYQNKWYQHVNRMPPERLPLQAFLYTPVGRRDIGRPRRRWRQQFT